MSGELGAWEQILSGLVLGYLVLSISESASHNHFLHGSRKLRQAWLKLGKVGAYIHNSWYSHHVVHHYRTFRQDHVTQFTSTDEEQGLRSKLTQMGKRQIALNSYGLRVGVAKEWLKYMYPHLPHYSLLCWFGGGWFTVGALGPLFFYGWLAHYVHPYLHLSYDQALKTCSPLMRPFLQSAYFKFLAQHHYLHHRYVDSNFNLLLGGDFFWRRQRFASDIDRQDMQRLGLFVPEKGKQSVPFEPALETAAGLSREPSLIDLANMTDLADLADIDTH